MHVMSSISSYLYKVSMLVMSSITHFMSSITLISTTTP